jgi:hypothetical protein
LKRFRIRPTYSNVVATLALFFALAGGAWAATQLPKESVGSTQLKNGAVTPGKLSAQAKAGFTGARGEAGSQGALGPRGNEGPRGENGTAGATGPQGVHGANGATGATGARGEPGEIGPPGQHGPEGPTGAEGPRGQEGQRGVEGQRGPEGKQGEEGPRGAAGKTGEEGKAGAEGKQGPTGPSDAYVDVGEPTADEVTNPSKGANIPLEIRNLPAGKYVLQAILTVQGTGKPALAECRFEGEGPEGESPGITLAPSEPFRATVTEGAYASLAGTTTAVVTEPSTVYLACEAPEAETSFVIPAESGHLTVTKVGALHIAAP